MSDQPALENFAKNSRFSKRTAQRFVAGEKIEDAIRVVQQLNPKGATATLDYLGENVTTREEAAGASTEYVKALEAIDRSSVQCNVSLKLTQFGLTIAQDFCQENVEKVVLKAQEKNNFVRIDMEGSAYTQATLDIFSALHAKYQNVGIVIQAYLYRSEQDIHDMLQKKVRIRLCKGAYKEPPEIAFKKKSDTDQNYVKLMKILLKSGIYHGIATHDPAMIRATKEFAKAENISANDFEFQMLYGIRRDLQDQLLREGYRLRVYIPYGEDWYSYLMRRMAERPANLLFVLRNLVRG